MAFPQKKKGKKKKAFSDNEKKSINNYEAAGEVAGAGAVVTKRGGGNPVKGAKKSLKSYNTKMAAAQKDSDAGGPENRKAAKLVGKAKRNRQRAGYSRATAEWNAGSGTKKGVRKAKVGVKIANAQNNLAGRQGAKASKVLAKGAKVAARKNSTGNVFVRGAKASVKVQARSKVVQAAYAGGIAAGAGRAAYISYKKRTKNGKIITVKRKRAAKRP